MSGASSRGLDRDCVGDLHDNDGDIDDAKGDQYDAQGDLRAADDNLGGTTPDNGVVREDDGERLRRVYRDILSRAPENDITPSRDTITALLGMLGDPQQCYSSVHIGGTNGKTSASRMVERLLREHGLRTGLFTSPHLRDMRERIVIDGQPIGEREFLAAWNDIQLALAAVDDMDTVSRPSFFEVLVALAYSVFADVPVEAAVIEVGLGGLWDATNAIDAPVAMLMPISLDHQHLLGESVEQIATEKVGIIKRGATVVTSEQTDVVTDIIESRVDLMDARLLREGIDFGVLSRQTAVGGQLLSLCGVAGEYHDVFLPLHGAHQARNAACALAAAEAFLVNGDVRLEPHLVASALAGVESPGRLEVVRRSPTIVVDAAHNPAGAQSLADAIEEAFAFTRVVGLFGVLQEKDAMGILEAVQPVLDEIVITASASPRAIPADELGEMAGDVFGEDRVHVVHNVPDAIDVAATRAERDGGPGGAVVVAGSITLVGEVRTLLGKS